MSKSNTPSTSSVQTQLRDFYSQSKTKLIELKKQMQQAELEYASEKALNDNIQFKYSETLSHSKSLDLQLKGLEQRIITARKRKNELDFQIKSLSSQIPTADEEIRYMNSQTEFKLKHVNDDIERVRLLERNQLGQIGQAIKKEEDKNKQLKESIAQMEKSIKEIYNELDRIHGIEGEKMNALLKDTADMNKFLSEI